MQNIRVVYMGTPEFSLKPLDIILTIVDMIDIILISFNVR